MDDVSPEKASIDYFQFHFTTIFGDLKAVEFPASIWGEMCEGTGVDGSSLGFLRTEQSDMMVRPDTGSYAVLPWDARVARLVCDILNDDGSPHVACPRSVLKKAVARAAEMGFEYRTRPELEWYYVAGEEPADRGSYMDTLPYDAHSMLRRSTMDDVQSMGCSVKTIHHENGPGQQEFEFVAGSALRMADDVQTAKMVVKMTAHVDGITATFMPKPFPQEAGSGMHIHQYLEKDGVNMFADPDQGVSEFLIHYVGGIMEHVDAITALLNPTTNSYKRLVPGHEAPVYKSWGVANRTALVRIPGYERSARIEYRATDCAANIYLAEALLLAAGLDGVRRKAEPMQPTRENVEKMTKAQRKKNGIGQLPSSLEEALGHLEGSGFAKDVLGGEMVDIFLEQKKREYGEYLEAERLGESEARAWELKRYLARS